MARLPVVIGRGVDAAKPASPTEGYLYFVTDVGGGKLQRYSGAAWEDVEGSGSIAGASTGHIEVNAGVLSVVKDNFSAADAPDQNDDSGSDYEIGSLWYDLTHDRAYLCLDASVGAAVWIELTVPEGTFFLSAAGMWPSTTNGCGNPTKIEFATNDVDVYVLPFDPDSNEYAQVTTTMPPDYDGGVVDARFIWTTATYYLGGTVIWGIQGIAYADIDNIDQAWGAAQTVSDDNMSANTEHVTDYTASVTLAGSPAGGRRVQFRVYRNATGDDHIHDARLIGVVVRYTRRTS